MNSNAIVGFGNARSERDYYPTPPDVTEALIRLLDAKHLLLPCDRIWECACGSGDMAKVFMDHNYSVLATDITTGVDFLKTEKRGCDWIITNPPFCLAEDFIRRASDMRVPFAFLLKATYWHSK